MAKTWLVRAGREGAFVDDFVSSGVVAIGWRELGQIDNATSKEEIVRRYHTCFPSDSEAQVRKGASTINRFLHEVNVGDTVVTYDRNRRLYHVGTVRSDVVWSPDTIADLPRTRQIQWSKVVLRDHLNPETINTLGAIQTLIEIKTNAANDIMQHAVTPEQLGALPVKPAVSRGESEEAEVAAEQRKEQFLEGAGESIEDWIARLDWEELQNLVAGILRAMGYRTTVSPRGSDRGVDIFASPDGLGLQDPRIFVEVKHRTGSAIGAEEIRSFIGGRNAGDKCLYVSTGGFTREAKYEADRAGVALKLLELVDLRRLLVDNYEKLDEEMRNLVPLKRIYILAK
jgi:restriction system protein